MDFELNKDIRQKQLEQWNEAYMALPRLGTSSQNGAAVRAAIKAEWFLSPPVEFKNGKTNEAAQYLYDGVDVGDMLPRDVIKVAAAIDALYVELTAVDPN